MNAAVLLAQLNGAGIHLALKGENIKIRAEKGLVTPQIAAQLKGAKAEIIQLLQQAQLRESQNSNLLAVIAATVAATPDATAFSSVDGDTSYRQLWQSAGELAANLKTHDVNHSSTVVLHLPTGASCLATILACMMLGAVVVPCDVADSCSYKRQLLGRFEQPVVVGETAIFDQADSSEFAQILLGPELFESDAKVEQPVVAVTPQRPLSCVINGDRVIQTDHSGVIDYIQNLQLRCGFGLSRGYLWHASLDSANTLWSVLGVLAYGGCVMLASEAGRNGQGSIAADVRRCRPGMLELGADQLALLLAEADADSSDEKITIDTVICRGQIPSDGLIERFHQCFDGQLFYLYAPSEAAQVMAVRLCSVGTQGTPNSLGWPGEQQMVVLDRQLNPVADNIVGDIYVNNHSVAMPLGVRCDRARTIRYGQDGMTILVATNDRGRRKSDGSFELVETTDNRVWLGERQLPTELIDNCLAGDEAVVDSYTLLLDSGEHGSVLTSFLVAQSPLSENQYRKLLEALPKYLQPRNLLQINRMPVNSAGIIDSKVLKGLDNIGVHQDGLKQMLLRQAQVDDAAVISVPRQVAANPSLHIDHLFDQPKVAIQDLDDNPQQTAKLPSASAANGEDLAIADGGPLNLPPDRAKTLTEALLKVAENYPDKGVRFIAKDGSEAMVPYRELLMDAAKILAGLQAQKLQPGSRVILQLSGSRPALTGFWACVLGGFIPVQISVAPSYEKANALVDKLKNTWLLLDKPPILASASLSGAIAALDTVMEMNDIRVLDIEQMVASEPSYDYHIGDENDILFYQLSSGSTGVPKCIQERHKGLISHVYGASAFNGYQHQDVLLNWLPLDHVGAMLMFHLRGVYLGCEQIQIDTDTIINNPLFWLDCIEKYQVTHSWAPNFAYKLVADAVVHAPSRSWDLSSLKLTMNAGEQVTPQVVGECIEALAEFGFREDMMHPAYGMAETCTAITYHTGYKHAEGTCRIPLNDGKMSPAFYRLGKPMPGVVLRIADSNNQALANGQIGRLQVKGNIITPGYVNNQQANEEVFTDDGWFNTGDMGFLQDGQLSITGREKEMIIIAGANFYCYEIEDVVGGVDGVKATFVGACAVKDKHQEAEALAVFYSPEEPHDGVNKALHQRIQTRITEYMGISAAYILPLAADDFPKTTSGKIQRNSLAKQFSQGDFDALIEQADILFENARTLPDWFYRHHWRLEQPRLKQKQRKFGKVLLFCDEHGSAAALADMITPDTEAVIKVECSNRFARLGDNHYQINPHDGDDYLELFSDIGDYDTDISDIVYCLTVSKTLAGASPLPGLDVCRRSMLPGLLYLSRHGLSRLQHTKVWLVSNGALFHVDDRQVAAEKGVLNGFFKSMAQEYPQMAFRHIDSDAQPGETMAAEVYGEMQLHSDTLAVLYRGRKRYTEVFEKLAKRGFRSHATPLTGKGFYLLPGGLGGIGSIVAEALLQQLGLKLLVVGRQMIGDTSNTTSGPAARLGELQKLHGEVLYYPADVCDAHAIDCAVDAAQQHWQLPLQGVFHLAGDYADMSLASASSAELRQALKIKVDGALVLHQALMKSPIAAGDKLFVHFSSVLATVGGGNSSGYAAANSFLGHFCHYQVLGGINSYCLHWSMWDEIGMSRGQALKSLFYAKGFAPVSASRGFNSMLTVLQQGVSVAMVGVDPVVMMGHQHTTFDVTTSNELVGCYSGQLQAAEVQQLNRRFGNVRLVELPQLPYLDNGNVDYRALSALVSDSRGSRQLKPQTESEKVIFSIWQAVLRLDSLSIDDNFFEKGGHSLLATRVVNEIYRSFGVEIEVKDLFNSPTIASLAATVDTLYSSKPDESKMIEVTDRSGPLPLSFAQHRMYLMEQLEQVSGVYNIPVAMELNGELDVAALQHAFDAIVARHETLRTVIREIDGESRQLVRQTMAVPLALIDLTEQQWDYHQDAFQDMLRIEAGGAFDLAAGPLLRLKLYRLAGQNHVLHITLHHIVSDGWSGGVLIREIGYFYNQTVASDGAALPEIEIQYGDFAQWQRSYLDEERLSAQFAYWSKKLAGLPPLLEIPSDRPRPARQSYDGATMEVRLGKTLSRQLRQFCRDHNVTLFMVLLSAYQLLLWRYSRNSDIAVGSPIANRTNAAVKDLIGLFVNTLVHRATINPQDDFIHHVLANKQSTLAAYEHQDIPFEQVVERLQPERSLSYPPLFQVFFALQNASNEQLSMSGLNCTLHLVANDTAKFDVSLILFDDPDEVYGVFEYCTALFEATTIERMAEHFKVLVEGLLQQPHMPVQEVGLLTEPEKQLLLDWGTTDEQPYTELTTWQLFERQEKKTPNAIAVRHGSESIDYHHLEQRANQLARYLRHQGIGASQLVAVYLERSIDLVVSLLAVMKTGAGYVPLDPKFPQQRIVHMLEDSEAGMIITSSALVRSLPLELPETILLDQAWSQQLSGFSVAPLKPHDLAGEPGEVAYVIFTSGSTGRPKGVVINHQALANFLQSFMARVGVEDQDNWLAVTTIAFDIATAELYGPLICGATVVLAEPQDVTDGEKLQGLLTQYDISVMQSTPSLWKLLIDSGWSGARQLTALCGGEALPEALIAPLLQRCKRLYNCYGPTEATVWSLVKAVESEQTLAQQLSVGGSLPGLQHFVLSPQLQLQPIGVPGELYISGVGLAEGYLKLPHVTDKAFITQCLDGGQPTRLYRTGDIVRWMDDGGLAFSGRDDNQVKIRGYRIELGEIEAAIAKMAEVDSAVVVVQSHNEDKRLVAYVVYDQAFKAVDTEALLQQIEQQLKLQLPDYMRPRYWQILDAMPLTANGKINRKALPGLDFSGQSSSGFVAPGSPRQQLLAAMWSELLGGKSVGLNDDFFAIGGHSLLASRIVSRIREAFDVSLPLRQLFEAPTIAELDRYIEAQVGGKPGLLPLTAVPRNARLPLSFAQQRLWFLDKFEQRSHIYHMAGSVDIRGALNQRALEQVFCAIISRHEVLRTGLVETIDGQLQGTAEQQIHKHVSFSLPCHDLSGMTASEREQQLDALTHSHAKDPFDLTKPPLMRAAVVQLDREHFRLLVNMHHIVSDGWSSGVLIREMVAHYEAAAKGEVADLEPLTLQYADYAYWQHQQLEASHMRSQLAYWRTQLDNLPPLLALPTDRIRPAQQRFNGATVDVRLGQRLSEQVNQFSQAQSCTVFMTLLAAWNLLMSRYSGQGDIAVGTPIANRTHAALEPLIGFFVNTLVIRSQIDGQASFEQLLAGVKKHTLDAYENQDLPFEQLVEALDVERSLSYSPLFQVMFSLQNAPAEQLTMGELEVEILPPVSEVAKFDLTLNLSETEQGFVGTLEYDTDLFETQTIERLVAHYQLLLSRLLAQPRVAVDEISLLSDDDDRRLNQWQQTNAVVEYGTISSGFETMVERYPQHCALSCNTSRLSYAELNRKANQLAWYLLERGVGPQSTIALCTSRSFAMVEAMLAILKVGAVYVPLDAKLPEVRQNLILKDTAVDFVLSDQNLPGQIGELYQVLDLPDLADAVSNYSDVNPQCQVADNAMAYIMYTSGSTGTPKGVCVNHRAVVSLVRDVDYVQLNDSTVVLGHSAISFDASTFEIYAALLNGGRLVLSDTLSLADMAKLISTEQINTMWLTAGLFHSLVEEAPQTLNGITQLLVGGDVVNTDAVNQVLAQIAGIRVTNGYGPTENTTFTCVNTITESLPQDQAFAIGGPLQRTKVLILDSLGRPCPIGVPGELCAGGDGLALGYLNRPGLTAEQFVPNPLAQQAGERLYRTGDRARFLSDGSLAFMGRIDNQVKLRGFRVEPGEVQSAVARLPGVQGAAVVVRQDEQGNKRLVAYVAGDKQGLSQWQSALKQQLPEYMQPSLWQCLDVLPLTANGKVDRNALPKVQFQSNQAQFESPQGAVEIVLAEIWQQLLGAKHIGRFDNFFSLGGDSIISIQMIARARSQGFLLNPKQIFESQTLAELALVAQPLNRTMARQSEITGEVGFTPIQHWFFDKINRQINHFNQSVLLSCPPDTNLQHLEQALAHLCRHHDMLRGRYQLQGGQWHQSLVSFDDAWCHGLLQCIDLSSLDERSRAASLSDHCNRLQRSLKLSERIVQAGYFDYGEQPGRLLLVCHHLVVDGISWRVLLEDLNSAYRQLTAGRDVQLAEKSHGFDQWVERLHSYARSDELNEQMGYWQSLAGLGFEPINKDLPGDYADNTEASVQQCEFSLAGEQTDALLREVSQAYRTQINDLLLSALLLAYHKYSGDKRLWLTLEGHGREALFDDLDISRTVGWFTAMYPVCLILSDDELGQCLKSVKEQLRSIPSQGVGFGLLRYLGAGAQQSALATLPQPQLSFNYLGRFDQQSAEPPLFSSVDGESGMIHGPEQQRTHLWDINALVIDGSLKVTLQYSRSLHSPQSAGHFMQLFEQQLNLLIDYCRDPDHVGMTPSDIPTVSMDQNQLDKVLRLQMQELEQHAAQQGDGDEDSIEDDDLDFEFKL